MSGAKEKEIQRKRNRCEQTEDTKEQRGTKRVARAIHGAKSQLSRSTNTDTQAERLPQADRVHRSEACAPLTPCSRPWGPTSRKEEQGPPLLPNLHKERKKGAEENEHTSADDNRAQAQRLPYLLRT